MKIIFAATEWIAWMDLYTIDRYILMEIKEKSLIWQWNYYLAEFNNRFYIQILIASVRIEGLKRNWTNVIVLKRPYEISDLNIIKKNVGRMAN